MNLKPFENTQLYGMNDYFKEIIKLYKQKKMPSKNINALKILLNFCIGLKTKFINSLNTIIIDFELISKE